MELDLMEEAFDLACPTGGENTNGGSLSIGTLPALARRSTHEMLWRPNRGTELTPGGSTRNPPTEQAQSRQEEMGRLRYQMIPVGIVNVPVLFRPMNSNCRFNSTLAHGAKAKPASE